MLSDFAACVCLSILILIVIVLGILSYYLDQQKRGLTISPDQLTSLLFAAQVSIAVTVIVIVWVVYSILTIHA